MTGLDLDAIEARANAATPGPWGVGNETAVASEMKQESRGTISYRHWIADLDDFNRDESDYPNPVAPAADAAFIAHARTDVPALVAEVRRFKPVAWNSGEQLYAHRCNNVEWWHEATQGPINEQGCDACESAPDGGWRPVYVRAERARTQETTR